VPFLQQCYGYGFSAFEAASEAFAVVSSVQVSALH